MFGSITKQISCLACIAGLAMSLAACGGGGSSNAQQIRQLYTGAISALAHKNWSQVCSDMTREQQTQVVARARSSRLSASTCPQALTKVAAADPSWAASVRLLNNAIKLKVQSVSVHGNQASARVAASYHGKTSVGSQSFVRQNGRWLLNRTPTG